jgi:hypothetical protein
MKASTGYKIPIKINKKDYVKCSICPESLLETVKMFQAVFPQSKIVARKRGSDDRHRDSNSG